jgi:hypothetical protein
MARSTSTNGRLRPSSRRSDGAVPGALNVNQGNQTTFLDPYSLKPTTSLQTFQSPDNAATVAATLRGQNLTDARARDTLQQGKTQLLNDPNQGPLVVNKSTGVATPVVGARTETRVPSDAQAKQLKGSQRALDIINDAEKLINGATGSYIGNAVDKGAQAFGLPRQAPKDIARLKALEGSLMMAQPRMEGPQSDKDVALYRQMSGQIGDPNVPGGDQAAALDTIRSLHEKYAGVQQQSPVKSASAPPVPMKGMTRGGYKLHWRQPRRPVELGESLMPAPWEEYAAASAASAKPWEEYAGKDAGKAPEKSLTDKALAAGGNMLAGAVRGAGSIGATILLQSTPLRVQWVCKTTSSAARTAARQWTAACARWARTRTRSPSRAASWARRSPGLLVLVDCSPTACGHSAQPAPLRAWSRHQRCGARPGDGWLSGWRPCRHRSRDARTAGHGCSGGRRFGRHGEPVGHRGRVRRLAQSCPVRRNWREGWQRSPAGIRSRNRPEVRSFAQRAQQMGINIPADRIVDSKPLNALAAGLNYVPFSGRAATEDAMASQLNRKLSNTFGQDSPNVTMALRKADDVLGSQFDNFLKSNTVKVDQKFMDDLAAATNQASKELGSEGAGIITKQVDEIMGKAATGEIDGQAAYNIKKTLDRIGKRNSPEAWYALDLKAKLMDALDRSVGAQKAAEFKGLAPAVRKHAGPSEDGDQRGRG